MRNILTTILLLAALTVAAQNYSPCYKEKYEAGVALYNKGDYNGAKAKFVASKSCPMPNTAQADEWIRKCENNVGSNNGFVIPQLDMSMVLEEDKELVDKDMDQVLLLLALWANKYNANDEETTRNYEHLQNLLKMNPIPIKSGDLMGYKKVRSFQASLYHSLYFYAIYVYPYFGCRFSVSNGKLFFEKYAGSQRKSGYLYRKDDHTLVFLGGSYVEGYPKTEYGSDDSVLGTLYRLSSNKIVMLFWEKYDDGDIRLEIYEFSK